MLFVEQACGPLVWLLGPTWCPRAPCWGTISNFITSSNLLSSSNYCCCYYYHIIVNLLHWRMMLHATVLFSCFRSNEVWVLDLEQWSWSKPPIAGPSPHPRGGQSQVRLNKWHCCSFACGRMNEAFLKRRRCHNSTSRKSFCLILISSDRD